PRRGRCARRTPGCRPASACDSRRNAPRRAARLGNPSSTWRRRSPASRRRRGRGSPRRPLGWRFRSATRRHHTCAPLASTPHPDEFRRAMGLVPTAVTVITAPGTDGPSGATANAVVSLSLEPPLMLAALDRGSRTLAALRAAGAFGVSVLAAGQAEL